jgi:hypothetical protein
VNNKTKEDLAMSKSSENYGNTRLVITGTIIVMMGLVVEFLGRFFGYANNPLSAYHPIVAALAGIAAMVVVLGGVFTLGSGRATRDAMTQRKGMFLLVLGSAMIIGFFLFKQVIPHVFG